MQTSYCSGSTPRRWPRSAITVARAIRTIEATVKLPRFRAPVMVPKPAPQANGAPRPIGQLDVVDLDGLRQLKQLGADLSKPHTPEFFLLVLAAPEAEQAAAKAKALGYATDLKPAGPGAEWQLRAERNMVLNDEALKRARYHFERIARAGGGRYSGRESAAVK